MVENDVIFFDGVCNLCSGFVQYILMHEDKPHFKFASLQSEFASQMFKDANISITNENGDYQSVYLYKNNKLINKSTAVIEISRSLNSWGKIAVILYIFPRFFRDWVYDFVARNRYKWFGKQDICYLPKPEWKNRFLS
jgi:predicted DCC family thiol-disulfide oxidoreductase YuxK